MAVDGPTACAVAWTGGGPFVEPCAGAGVTLGTAALWLASWDADGAGTCERLSFVAGIEAGAWGATWAGAVEAAEVD